MDEVFSFFLHYNLFRQPKTWFLNILFWEGFLRKLFLRLQKSVIYFMLELNQVSPFLYLILHIYISSQAMVYNRERTATILHLEGDKAADPWQKKEVTTYKLDLS